MKKLTKINFYILISSLLLEFGFLNYYLRFHTGITISNNINAFVRINVLELGLDLIFLISLDCFNKKRKDLINKVKEDLNTTILGKFIIFIIIKTIIQVIFLDKIYYSSKILVYYIFYELGILILFIILYKVMPKNEDYGLKIRRFKRNLKKEKNSFNYVIVPDEGKLSSTLEVKENIDYKIDKDHFYIKNKEIKELSKNYPAIKEIIDRNTILKVYYVKSDNEIKRLYEKDKEKFIYEVMVKNYGEEKDNSYSALKIVNENENILEEIENILAKNSDHISFKKYKRAKKRYIRSGNINDLLIICKYYYQNRLTDKQREVPKNNFLLELYKKAYFTDSAYQSVLILLNYMGALTKSVLYYLYAKNSDSFNKEEINREISTDNIPIWKRNIFNLVKKSDDIYQNIKEQSISLTNEELNIIRNYMKYLLNVEIEGEELTFLGLFELIRQLRNKVEAHGSINEENVYIIWYLFDLFIDKLNVIFKVNNLEIESDKAGIKIKYVKEQKWTYIGEYIININDALWFIFPKDKSNNIDNNLAKEERNYINYFNGNQEYKPEILKKER